MVITVLALIFLFVIVGVIIGCQPS